MLQCQRGQLTKQHLYISVIIHLSLVIFLIIPSIFKPSRKSFVVLGAHSSKESFAYFKPLKLPRAQKSSVASTLAAKPKPVVKKRIPVLKKKLALKKKMVKKKVLKPKPIVKKPELVKKAIPKPEPVKQAEVKPAVPKEETVTQQEQMPINLSDNTDPRCDRYQKEVQREISRVWRPPVGVAQGTECVLMVAVGAEGEVKKVELVTKSKVLVYDLSVLQAAKDFQFSKALWDNSLLITFRQ